jgi:hypothetical protein
MGVLRGFLSCHSTVIVTITHQEHVKHWQLIKTPAVEMSQVNMWLRFELLLWFGPPPMHHVMHALAVHVINKAGATAHMGLQYVLGQPYYVCTPSM